MAHQAEQNRVFDLSRRRSTRVVLATNVAETSLTIEGISVVVDSGLVREALFDPATGRRLPVNGDGDFVDLGVVTIIPATEAGSP